MEQSIATSVLFNRHHQIAQLDITSRAFSNSGSIPEKYTYDGENINPSLNIGNLPDETKSMALIVDGLDAAGKLWTHWLVWNIPPVSHISENSIPGIQGLNDFWVHNYEGPCAPKGVHKYFFRVYALDCELQLTGVIQRAGLEAAIKKHVLACGQLMGQYNWHSKG